MSGETQCNELTEHQEQFQRHINDSWLALRRERKERGEMIGALADLCTAKGIAVVETDSVRIEMAPHVFAAAAVSREVHDSEPEPEGDPAFDATGMHPVNLRELRSKRSKRS